MTILTASELKLFVMPGNKEIPDETLDKVLEWFENNEETSRLMLEKLETEFDWGAGGGQDDDRTAGDLAFIRLGEFLMHADKAQMKSVLQFLEARRSIDFGG